MPNPSFRPLALAAVLASSACASTPTTPETRVSPPSQASFQTLPIREWPLRFKTHSFSVMTYDTWGAKVVYAGWARRTDEPDVLQRSSASYGPHWQRNWGGTFGGIRNFPEPAQLSWRSKDGTPHKAEIDIGEIFSDQVIRHRVTREEMADQPDGEYQFEPAVILEINDRTVRVYMHAFIPLKRRVEQQGGMRGGFVAEPVLVKTYTY